MDTTVKVVVVDCSSYGAFVGCCFRRIEWLLGCIVAHSGGTLTMPVRLAAKPTVPEGLAELGRCPWGDRLRFESCEGRPSITQAKRPLRDGQLRDPCPLR